MARRAKRHHRRRRHARSRRGHSRQNMKFKAAVKACWKEGPGSAKALGKCMRRKLKK